MDFNFSIREYDKWINQRYKDALRIKETTAGNVLEYWLEITEPIKKGNI